MKTLLPFIAVAIMTIAPNVFAQLTGKGIKAGMSFATFGGADAKDLDPQSITTFNAGGFVTFDAGGLFTIQPEMFFIVKGVKVGGIIVAFGQTYNFIATAKISYLEIPVLVKLTFHPPHSGS